MTVEFALTLVALGFAGSFISGLVGVGGAIVMVPLLYYVPPLLAVGRLEIRYVAGVTMVQVLAAALVGAWTHGRHALVHRALARTGGVAMAAGALVGAVGSRFLEGRILLGVFAGMATLALPLMFVRLGRLPQAIQADRVPFSRPAAIIYPGGIGLLSGLVGAGGAFLLAPVLIALLRIPVRVSIGTSLAMTAMSATMGVLGKAVTLQIPVGPAVAVLAGSLAGARLGAQASQHAPVALLRWVLVGAIGAVMVWIWVEVLFG